jgi:phosphatidylserine/phosphatidylglycerophosphate/cardiolipin synthase-like enzyme
MAAAQPVLRRGATTRIVLLALMLPLTIFLYQSGQLQELAAHAAGRIGLAPPKPQLGALRVFFTTPALVYPDASQQRPMSPLLVAVLADLDAARVSVDLASFDLDIPAITDALLRANRRGVVVRVVVDSENLDTPEVSEQTGRLQRAGIAVHFDRREPFMHNKFVVVDGAVAWMGSWNVTDNEMSLG